MFSFILGFLVAAALAVAFAPKLTPKLMELHLKVKDRLLTKCK